MERGDGQVFLRPAVSPWGRLWPPAGRGGHQSQTYQSVSTADHSHVPWVLIQLGSRGVGRRDPLRLERPPDE